MRTSRILAVGLLTAGLWAADARGQIGAPAAPAAAPAAAAPAAAVPGAPAAAAAAPAALGPFAKFCAAFKACKAKLCATPLGQMLNQITRPATALTGGIIPPFCPIVPSPAELAQPGAAGAAAAAKKDAAEAAARRAAVRYLGTLDCRYYPDAEAMLIAALRGDPSECVRLEAALALNRGCCCTRRTIEALEITVSGGDRDGFPSERSERVRAAAAMALHHCVQCFIEVVTVEPPLKDKDKEQEKEREQEGLVRAGEAKGEHGLLPAADDAPAGGAKDKSANKPSSNKPDRELILRALRTLENAEFRSVNPLDPTQSRFRDRGVFDIIGDAVFPPEVEGGMIVPDAAPALPAPRVLPGVPVEAAPAPSPYSGLQGRATPAPAPAQPVRTVVITAQVPSETHSGEALVVRAVGTGGAQPVRQTAAAEAQEPSEVIRRCLSVMATATAAADRHKAIHVLASYDCRTHPEVLSGLARSARHDREPAVRVDCLRRLAALGVATPEVLAELKAVCADPDPWVREEAVQAMARLQGQGR